MQEVSGRDIAITPEMIEAGADVILGCDLEEYRAHQIAEMVFKAMLLCRSPEGASLSSLGPSLKG